MKKNSMQTLIQAFRWCLVGLAFAIVGRLHAEPPAFRLAQWLRPLPRHSVLSEPGYYVWGASPIQDGGQYHLFYSRWSTNTYAWGDGWLFTSEICHAVAATPDER